MMRSRKKVLVSGAQGMLGRDCIETLIRMGVTLTATDLRRGTIGEVRVRELDITDAAQVLEVLRDGKPDWVVNCAAFTKVDDAEKEPELCFRVNAEGVRHLARACASVGAKMLHLSTDYVFGGNHGQSPRREPYREGDSPDACGVYGQSKLAGEKYLVAELPENHLLVRTSWLHGQYGPNFISTILRLASERKEIRVVNDQVGSPTYSLWLAARLVELLEKDARGTYHVSSRGNISWFDFAREILNIAGRSVELRPQTTEELGRPAPRPAYSTLELSKVEQFTGEPCPSWKEGVKAHLKLLGVVEREEHG